MSKLDAESIECGVVPRSLIDEEGCNVALVYPVKFVEKHPCGDSGSRRKEPHVGQVVCLRIDSSEQTVFLSADPDDCLVERDLIL